jgi:repressor LexA
MSKATTMPLEARLLLQAIADFQTEHTYAPSRRELVRILGYRSTSAVSYHMAYLLGAGLLDLAPGIARGLTLTAKGRAELRA